MEILLTWVEVAYSLADILGKSMKSVEDAFDTFEKARDKVTEARLMIEDLQRAPDASEEELHSVRSAYQRVLRQIKIEQSKLFLTTLDSVISSLKSMRGHTSADYSSLLEDIQQKITSTQLEQLLGTTQRDTYTKLEAALKRACAGSAN